MNVEQTLRAVLADEAAAMRPAPDGLDRIERRAARRARPGWLVPALAGAVVLALVAIVLPSLRQPTNLGPADSLYRREGVVWPFATTADALNWRRFPDGAPELADPESTAREYAKSVLGPDAGVEPGEGGWRPTSPQAPVRATIVVEPGPDGKAPYVVVAVRSDLLSIDRPGEVRDGTPLRLRGAATAPRETPDAPEETEDRVSVRVNDRYGQVGQNKSRREGDGWHRELRLNEVPRERHGALVVGARLGGELALAAIPVTFAEHRTPGPVGGPPVPVMYAVDAEHRLVEVDTATGTPRRMFTQPRAEYEPVSLQLTRTELYYSVGDKDCYSIRAVRLSDGSDREVVPNGMSPAVSPDGTRLAYLRRACGPGNSKSELVLRDLRSGAERRIPGGVIDQASRPSWTPDGRSLVFSAWVPGAPPRVFPATLDVDAARTLDDSRPLPVRAEPNCHFSDFKYAAERLVGLYTCQTVQQVVALDPRTGAVTDTLIRVDVDPDQSNRIETFAVDATGRHVLIDREGLEHRDWTFYGPSGHWVPGDYRSGVW